MAYPYTDAALIRLAPPIPCILLSAYIFKVINRTSVIIVFDTLSLHEAKPLNMFEPLSLFQIIYAI